jgi:hypothetical protein
MDSEMGEAQGEEWLIVNEVHYVERRCSDQVTMGGATRLAMGSEESCYVFS